MGFGVQGRHEISSLGPANQCGHCHSEDSARGEGCQGDLRYAQVGVPYFLPIPHLARLCNESSLCAVSASALLNPTLVTRTAMLRGSAFHVAPSSKTMRALQYTMVSVETSWQCNLHPTGDDLVSLQTLRLFHASSTWAARWKHQHLAVQSLRMRLLNLGILPFIRLGCD